MQSASKTALTEALSGPERGLHFVIEPEPWLRIFLRNIADLFRPEPPKVWVTARPAEYWADALVHRPVAWRAVRQSFLIHALVAVAVYALNLAWLNQPQVVPEAPKTNSVLHYELSEYLPAINKARPETPKRMKPQKAGPELAPQEIVVTNENHISTRQTIVQPNPVILKHDIPMPNLVASTAVPGAPMARTHALQMLPLNAPQIVAPPQATAQSSLRPLVFPPAAQPLVAPPPSAIASRKNMQLLPAEGPIVVPPAPEAVAHRTTALEIPAQAPQVAAPAQDAAANHALPKLPAIAAPQVAAPATDLATNHALPATPLAAPQVAAPAPAMANRNLSNIGLPVQATAAPPMQAVSGNNNAREKEIGQLLVLNAQPVAPSGQVTVPEGTRPGEFAASPAGHTGATAQPAIKQGNSAPANDIYVAAPAGKVAAGPVVAAAVPPVKPLSPERTDKPRDSIDTRIFGTRKNYSMKLSMPNLTSAVGSWSMRFAELKSTGAAHGESDLSAPEAIKKVDPAYPQDLVHDRVEGTVVLYAIIHSDGTVGEVRLLEGFDERLDQNAIKALQQWRFRPGTKDGQPVDVEAVVRVPFKVAQREF